MLRMTNIKTAEMGWSCLAAYVLSLRPNNLDDKEWLDALNFLAHRWEWQCGSVESASGCASYIQRYICTPKYKELVSNEEFMNDLKTLPRRVVRDKWHTSMNMIIAILGYAKKSLADSPEFQEDAKCMSNSELAVKYHIKPTTIATWRTQGKISKYIVSQKIIETGEFCKTHSIAEGARHFGEKWTSIKNRVDAYNAWCKRDS